MVDGAVADVRIGDRLVPYAATSERTAITPGSHQIVVSYGTSTSTRRVCFAPGDDVSIPVPFD